MSPIFARIWNSPMVTTWGGLLIRALGLAVMMPLVLVHFSNAQVAIWYLFASLAGMLLLFQFGFVPTFVRCISYARAGASSISSVSDKKISVDPTEGTVNCLLLQDILGVVRRVYVIILLVLLGFIVVGAPWLLKKPVQALAEPSTGWIAWTLIAGGNLATVFGGQFVAVLQGLSEVPLFRRNEMLFSLLEMISGVLLLVFTPGLVVLAANQCLWRIILVIRLRSVAGKALEGYGLSWKSGEYSRETFHQLWPATWRSGIGSLASTGSTQLSGIVYAQMDNSVGLASYLVGLRLMTFFSTFSTAPFYSRIPDLAKWYGEGQIAVLINKGRQWIAWSYITYAVLFIVGGLMGPWVFKFIGSSTPFPDSAIWILLGMGFLAHRHGAYFIQLYSLSNHIIWHIADSVSAILVFLAMALLVKPLGLTGLPSGMLAGMLAFYAWYPALKARSHFRLSFWNFELKTLGFPALLVGAYMLYETSTHHW